MRQQHPPTRLERRRRRTGAACSVALGLAVGLLGCGQPATRPPAPGRTAPAPVSPSAAASPSLTPASPPGVVRLTERDNHTTVTVPVGTRLDLTLASTHWSLSSSSPAIPQAAGATRYPAGPAGQAPAADLPN